MIINIKVDLISVTIDDDFNLGYPRLPFNFDFIVVKTLNEPNLLNRLLSV